MDLSKGWTLADCQGTIPSHKKERPVQVNREGRGSSPVTSGLTSAHALYSFQSSRGCAVWL